MKVKFEQPIVNKYYFRYFRDLGQLKISFMLIEMKLLEKLFPRFRVNMEPDLGDYVWSEI